MKSAQNHAPVVTVTEQDVSTVPIITNAAEMNATKESVLAVLKAGEKGVGVVHARKDSAPLSANSWNGTKMYPSVLHAQNQLLHASVSNAKSRRKRSSSYAKVWMTCIRSV